MPLITFLGKGILAAVFFPPRQSVSHLHLYLNQLKKKFAETASDLAEAARLSPALAEAAKYWQGPSRNSHFL